MSDLSAEDAKLVTLARATRARVGAAEGGAVRDGDGRTYAAASVDLPSLKLSALQVCVAMAVASGSTLARGRRPAHRGRRGRGRRPGRAAPTSPGAGVVVHRGDPRGTVHQTIST